MLMLFPIFKLQALHFVNTDHITCVGDDPGSLEDLHRRELATGPSKASGESFPSMHFYRHPHRSHVLARGAECGNQSWNLVSKTKEKSVEGEFAGSFQESDISQ
ncbi:hypothetical protein KIL84_008587, partial [Mauremys mutica]